MDIRQLLENEQEPSSDKYILTKPLAAPADEDERVVVRNHQVFDRDDRSIVRQCHFSVTDYSPQEYPVDLNTVADQWVDDVAVAVAEVLSGLTLRAPKNRKHPTFYGYLTVQGGSKEVCARLRDAVAAHLNPSLWYVEYGSRPWLLFNFKGVKQN